MIFHGPLRGLARTRQVVRQAVSDDAEALWGGRRFRFDGWRKTA
jgi:hypothetical protein